MKAKVLARSLKTGGIKIETPEGEEKWINPAEKGNTEWANVVRSGDNIEYELNENGDLTGLATGKEFKPVQYEKETPLENSKFRTRDEIIRSVALECATRNEQSGVPENVIVHAKEFAKYIRGG